MNRVAVVYNACIISGLIMQGAGVYASYGGPAALISTGFSVMALTVFGAWLMAKGH